MFAAENHGGGLVFVDIVTQPGLGPMRGSLDLMFRDDSLNARNAFQPEKGPEQTQQYTFNLSGTLLEVAHVVLAVGRRGVALRLGEHLRRDAGTARARRRSAGPPIASTSTGASTTR